MKKLIIMLAACGAFLTVRAAAPEFTWQQTATNLALLNHGKLVWQVVFDPALPKSFVHPLATINGAELTVRSPADHLWHRGLWWSWKYINHTNYWEEDKKTGLSAGRTEITGARPAVNKDFSGQVEIDFAYRLPGQPPVMTERRVLKFSAPAVDGAYSLDWNATFKILQNVELERTPPKKTSGGYAGLSLRFPRAFVPTWKFLTSNGKNVAAEANGDKLKWVDFSGPAPDGMPAGIAIFDHPANVRHPNNWYLNQIHPFFSPALVYSAPLTCKAGEELKLRYRILVHPGAGDAAKLGAAFAEFSQ
jgi:hypothetical protein